MDEVGIRILGFMSRHSGGPPTPYDGLLLAEYDPNRPGTDPDGRPMIAHVVATDDPAKAMRFPSAKEAIECWRQPSGHIRPDGKPDRPLTAFAMEIERLT